jgi:hypothetical protein
MEIVEKKGTFTIKGAIKHVTNVFRSFLFVGFFSSHVKMCVVFT